jgi:pyruvate dehydrogenase E2 component (dihydrolipoamide acetyltransferase)
MATEVIMPKVDMVMDTGTFVEWLKNEGDHVEKGEPLFVILTDKANIEIEAPASGVLAGVRVQPDDVIPVTEVIAYLLEPGESLPSYGDADLSPTEAISPAEAPAVAPQPEPVAAGVTLAESGPGDGTERPPVGKVRATPAARRLAAELGIDLALVSGRGARGRIHKADVLAFAEQRRPPVEPQPAVTAPALQIPLPDARQKEVVPLTGPRKIIADRMAYSAFTAPHITLSLRVDMNEAARLRARVQDPIQQKTGQRLSFTAIIARAVASVLPRHPYLNASLQGDEIIIWDDVHLGIATSLEDYLIVPVIREAQTKSLEQIVTALGDLVERARAKRLTPAEMSGSTFTLSNLGMFGIESFTAIINPPESAILAVGKIVDTPMRAEDGLELRPIMNLTLSADHRVVDGATAARFLAELKATLENPYLLI